MRCLSVRKIKHYVVDITPAPPFRWIKGFDDRVFSRVEMLCSVSIRRLIATTDMATAAANPQMQPGVARFQTFFASQGARNDVTDCRKMFAKYRHIQPTRTGPPLSVCLSVNSIAQLLSSRGPGSTARVTVVLGMATKYRPIAHLHQLLHRDRQVAHTLAGGMEHGIGDGRSSADYADFANCLAAEGTGMKVRFTD